MKKVFQTLGVVLFLSLLNYGLEAQVLDPNHPEFTTTTNQPLPQTIDCDRPLGSVGLPPSGASLTSTRNFAWFAPNPTIDIELATEIRIPQLASAGRQVIEKINFAGVNGGASDGRVSIWTDGGNVPGTMLYESAQMISGGNFLWDCTLEANNIIQPNVTYWISAYAIADGATLGQRWFWTHASAQNTSAAGYEQYAVYFRSATFGNCARWTTHTACPGAFQAGGSAMNWSADILC